MAMRSIQLQSSILNYLRDVRQIAPPIEREDYFHYVNLQINHRHDGLPKNN